MTETLTNNDQLSFLSDPIGFFTNIIGSMVSKIFGEIFDAFFTYLTDTITNYIISITDFSRFPFILELVRWTETGAGTLAVIIFIYRLLNAYKEQLTGDRGPNYAEILGNFVIGLALVFAIPYILLNFLIPLNNAIIKSLSYLIGNNMTDSLLTDIDNHMVPLANLSSGNGWFSIIALTIMLLSFGFIALAGFIRFMELTILLIVGPLMATSYINKGEAFRNYWMECIAVTFTQSIHFLLLVIVIQIGGITTNQVEKMFLFLAAAFVAMKGPSVLRKYMHSTGVSSVVSYVGHTASRAVALKFGRF